MVCWLLETLSSTFLKLLSRIIYGSLHFTKFSTSRTSHTGEGKFGWGLPAHIGDPRQVATGVVLELGIASERISDVRVPRATQATLYGSR